MPTVVICYFQPCLGASTNGRRLTEIVPRWRFSVKGMDSLQRCSDGDLPPQCRILGTTLSPDPVMPEVEWPIVCEATGTCPRPAHSNCLTHSVDRQADDNRRSWATRFSCSYVSRTVHRWIRWSSHPLHWPKDPAQAMCSKPYDLSGQALFLEIGID